jgi:hypothetical protein
MEIMKSRRVIVGALLCLPWPWPSSILYYSQVKAAERAEFGHTKGVTKRTIGILTAKSLSSALHVYR